MHGDQYAIEGEGFVVMADGRDVSMLYDDEYDSIWGGRVVDDWDVCDEWEAKS